MDINVNDVVTASLGIANARMALTQAEDRLKELLVGHSAAEPIGEFQIDRVLQAAKQFNGSGFGPKEIVKASGIPYGSVGVHLTKLVRQGKLRKLGKGRYEAK